MFYQCRTEWIAPTMRDLAPEAGIFFLLSKCPTSSWGKGNPYTVYLNLETIFGKIHYAQSISWPPGFPTSNPYSARAQFTQPHWIKRPLLSSRLLHVLSASHKKNCSNHAWPGTGRRDFFCSFQSALQVLRRLQKKVLQEWFASSQSQVKESPTLSLSHNNWGASSELQIQA